MLDEIEAIAKRLGGKRVMIQIPEGLVTEIEKIRSIFERYGSEVIFDLDPTYGACDIRVEESRAVGADKIVHIGHAPMMRVPDVIYVEWKRPFHVERLKEFLKDIDKRACIATTVNFRWVLDEIRDIENVVIGKGSWRIREEGVVLGCDTTACNVNADINVFLGDGLFHPLAIWVNTGRRTYAVRPDGSVEELRFEDVVKKRLAVIGMVDGKRVGIIVSSKIGQNRSALASDLKDLATERGYEPHIYVSDYIDPSYIEGLPEDFFVYTGCPRVPIDDGDRYPKPILTPEEFLLKIGALPSYRIGWITRVPPPDSGGSPP